MASKQSIVDYLVEQMSSAGPVTARKMFGEYAIYCGPKLVALVCDDELFIKPTRAGAALLGKVDERPPYQGAKPYLWISGDRWDDSDSLSELVHVTANALPLPPPKKRKAKTTAKGKTTAKLLVAMTGKASAAKAADGDEPVFAYIASLPKPQREIAERIDALAAKTLPGLKRAVKWGMAYYGVAGGWCFASGAFVGHVKLMFIRGTELRPEPPVTPIGMGKATRGVEPTSVAALDVRQAASWMKQAAAIPFVGGKKR